MLRTILGVNTTAGLPPVNIIGHARGAPRSLELTAEQQKALGAAGAQIGTTFFDTLKTSLMPPSPEPPPPPRPPPPPWWKQRDVQIALALGVLFVVAVAKGKI